MFTKLLMQETSSPLKPKEGDLYKEVTVSGKTFRLLYGYYESFERESPFSEPMPIYPDFTKDPYYTEEGFPLVTAMQNVCVYYSGKNDEDSGCADCVFFQADEELFGFCRCLQNRRSDQKGVVVQNE